MQTRIETLSLQFKQFLQEGSEKPLQGDHAKQHPVDLFRLFSELEALKAEVKREVRQQKEIFNRFQALMNTLEENNQSLTDSLNQQKESEKKVIYQAEEALLLELIDLQDRLQKTDQAIQNHKTSWLESRSAKTQLFQENLKMGMDITVRRLNQLLERYSIEAIETKGQRMNPHTMRVMEVRTDEQYEDGFVIEEVRSGYLREGKLLRLAEVVAARSPN